jgi:hypothetical protein
MVRAGGCAARGGRMPGPARELNGEICVPLLSQVERLFGNRGSEPKAKMSVQAINGRCLKCGYRLAWVLVGSRKTLTGLP